MATIKTVALAGASGDLGKQVLQALVEANFAVTVLARSESSSALPSAVKVAKIDYNNVQSLITALQGHDAVISTVGYAAFKGQEALIDAAIAAGVKRIIPSEYGTDPEVTAVRQLPVFGDKVRIEKYVTKQVQGTSTSYTLVCNNEFFDWDLDHNFGVDIKGKKMEVFDGGNTVFTATPMDFVARGIVSVLQHPAETANRVVRLHGSSLTQNKLLRMIQKFVGEEGWQLPQVDLAERERQAYEALQNDPTNFWAWGVPFLQSATWGKNYGIDLSGKNDNGLLGLKELTDAQIEEIIRKRT